MYFPSSDNRGLWFAFIPLYVEQATPSLPSFSFFEMSNLFVSLCSKKVYWSVTTEPWQQLSPFPVISILHRTSLGLHSVGEMHSQPLHTPPSSTIQPQPPWCHCRSSWWQRDAAAWFFPPSVLSSTLYFFFFSLGIKWSNDVLLQNSISQFS